MGFSIAGDMILSTKFAHERDSVEWLMFGSGFDYTSSHNTEIVARMERWNVGNSSILSDEANIPE